MESGLSGHHGQGSTGKREEMPFAEARGFLTDDDVFAMPS